MKKKIFILLIVLISLTGCIKNNIDMKLETNNNFNISIINGMQSVGTETPFTEESIQVYKDNGYKVENYDANGYTGIKLSAEIENINSVSAPDVSVVELTDIINHKVSEIKLFKIEKVTDGYLYTANFTYNLNLESISSASEISGGDLSSYSDMMELKYTITLPVKVEESNATNSSDHTYEWTLKFGEVNDIKFSFIIKDKDITKEKEEYQKEKENESNEQENINRKVTPADIVQSILGIVIVIGVIALYFFLKKKFFKKVSKKKKKGYHFEAPESIKEKK